MSSGDCSGTGGRRADRTAERHVPAACRQRGTGVCRFCVAPVRGVVWFNELVDTSVALTVALPGLVLVGASPGDGQTPAAALLRREIGWILRSRAGILVKMFTRS